MFEDSADLISSLDATYGNGMGQLVFEEFEKDNRKIQARMTQRTREIARANRARPNFAIDGLGPRTMSVDGDSWAYWANREPGCWQDKNFRREYLRDNEEARVPYTPAKTTVPVIKPATNYTKL